jgi:hypothetical protein
MLSTALNRPTSVQDYWICIVDFREVFAYYWYDLLGFPLEPSELAYCLSLFLVPQTLRYFQALDEAMADRDIERCLHDLVIHLNARVLGLRQYAMN